MAGMKASSDADSRHGRLQIVDVRLQDGMACIGKRTSAHQWRIADHGLGFAAEVLRVILAELLQLLLPDLALGYADTVGLQSAEALRDVARKLDLLCSPSETTSMPAAACCCTTSLTASRDWRANSAWSYAWPATLARMISRSGCGRARLPTCVVRIRSVLCFMQAVRFCARAAARNDSRLPNHRPRLPAGGSGGSRRGVCACNRAAERRDALRGVPTTRMAAHAASEHGPFVVVVQIQRVGDVLHEPNVTVGGIVARVAASDAPRPADQPGAAGARPTVDVHAGSCRLRARRGWPGRWRRSRVAAPRSRRSAHCGSAGQWLRRAPVPPRRGTRARVAGVRVRRLAIGAQRQDGGDAGRPQRLEGRNVERGLLAAGHDARLDPREVADAAQGRWAVHDGEIVPAKANRL